MSNDFFIQTLEANIEYYRNLLQANEDANSEDRDAWQQELFIARQKLITAKKMIVY